MSKKNLLEALGLNPVESAIYLALLDMNSASIAHIAEKTGLHRPVIYKALPSLITQGLVSVSPQGKRRQYNAESPERLRGIMEELSRNVEKFLPDIQQRYRARGKAPVVKFLQGKKGIRSVFDDLVRTLKKGDIFYRYSSRRADAESEGYLPIRYREIRDQKKLERFVITNESLAKKKKQRLERATKYIPREYDLFEYDIIQLIYHNRVAFIDYTTETAVIIENDAMVEFQKKIFMLLYRTL